MDARVLMLGLVLCRSGSWAQNSSAHTECSLSEEPKADVVILLDGFNHISPDDFSRVRHFLQTLVPKLGPVGPHLVQISLVKSGRDPEAEFYLDTFHNLSSVLANVSLMSQSLPLPGGSTNDAVDFIWENIFIKTQGHRENTPGVLILITDRNSSGVSTDLLNNLWSIDVKVFVVGVRVTNELQVRVTDRDDAEVFTVEDCNSFSNILKDLTQSLCFWLKEKLGRPPPESLRFTDVQPRRARVSWDCNSRQVLSFTLWVDPDHSEPYVQRIYVKGHKRSTEISHLLPNTSYTVAMRAQYKTGASNKETVVLTTPQDGVRLSGGPGRCSGSVELIERSGSSLCDFGLTEAAVVCGELDCGAVSELHQGALFTEGPAVSRSFHCDGAETSLRECESSETNCSTAAHISCTDAVLRSDYFRCFGYLHLRHKDEWRQVMTTVEPDLDFGSVLCEQMGCGSALHVEYINDVTGPFWWLEPECVKQRSGLADCLHLNSTKNVTKGRLSLLCSGFYPVVMTTVSSGRRSVSSEGRSVSSEGRSVSSEGRSVSSEGRSVSSEGRSVSSGGRSVSSGGRSVSSEGVSHLQRVLLKLGANFSVSCSLDEPFPLEQLRLLSPTGNYTLPPANHSAHFLFQAFSPAHIGNYTCAYCIGPYCFNSTLYITPGDSHLHIRAPIFVLILLLWAIALFFFFKRCRGQRTRIRRARHRRPSYENNMVEMDVL